MNAGQKVKAYCTANGMTICEFAERCGMSPITIHYWASGKREASLKCLMKIAKATNTSIMDWLGNEAA